MKPLPCKECGARCCSHPAVNDFELFRMQNMNPLIKDIKKTRIATGHWVLLGKDCPFLKDGRCSVYEVRPKACKDYGMKKNQPCQYLYPKQAEERVTELLLRNIERA